MWRGRRLLRTLFPMSLQFCVRIAANAIWARTEINVRDKSVYLGESFEMIEPSSAPVSAEEALKKLKESSENIKKRLETKGK